MKTYKKLKFKIEEDLLEECIRLPYYRYEDRDLVDAITGCAIKSIDGKANNLFKSVPDLCENYKFTEICGSIPKIVVTLVELEF